MTKYITIVISAIFLFVPQLTSARTNCDDQAKPAFDCPTGYSMMCIPVGGDHWGCGKEVNGQIVEWNQQPTPTLYEGTFTNTEPAPATGVVTQPGENTPPQVSDDISNTRSVNGQNQTAPTSTTTETQGKSISNTVPEPSPVAPDQPARVASPITTTNTSLALYAAVAAGVLALFWFGRREWLKKSKKTGPVIAPIKARKCTTCGGSGKVKQQRTKTAPCGHCKQTGLDICHHCGGTGRYGVGLTVPQTEEEVQSMMKCDYCEGAGFPKIPVACCMCKGAKKQTYTETYETTCPKCGGSGEGNR